MKRIEAIEMLDKLEKYFKKNHRKMQEDWEMNETCKLMKECIAEEMSAQDLLDALK
jgi:hypothetical protein